MKKRYKRTQHFNEISCYFDAIAASWDQSINQNDKEIACQIISQLKIDPTDTVLDVGAGTGLITPYLLRIINQPHRITAIDVSRKMLLLLKEKFPCIHAVHGDAHQFPFSNEQFNWVLCCNAFPHFIDQQRFIKEAMRVLRPAGKLVVFHTLSRQQLEQIHCKVQGIPQKAYLPSALELGNMMQKQGFISLYIHEDHRCYQVIGIKV